MKQILLLVIFGGILTMASAQKKPPVVKVYAYSQSTLKGVNPKGYIDENGKEVKVVPVSSESFLIYFTHSNNSSVKINEVWINQKAYVLKTEKIEKTPIIMADPVDANISKAKELVPATKNMVILITPVSLKKPSPQLSASFKKVAKNSQKSDLIICYTANGKRYYSIIKKIVQLEPAVAI